jgi:hypothetical protein
LAPTDLIKASALSQKALAEVPQVIDKGRIRSQGFVHEKKHLRHVVDFEQLL